MFVASAWRLSPLVACLALTLVAGRAEASDRIAVLEFAGDGSVDDNGLVFLAEKVRSAVLRHLDPADWDVITRENMLVMIGANAAGLSECEGECEVATGRLLGAGRIVAGSVVLFGSAYSVMLRLYDTKSGRLLASEEITADHLDGLRDGLDAGCLRLLDPMVEEPPAAPRARPPLEPLVRLGFHGAVALDSYGYDGAEMGAGLALLLPHLHVVFGAGIGLRAGFAFAYHPAGLPRGIDITWYEDTQDAGSETTEPVDASFIVCGAMLDFVYELTVPESSPAYRFTRWVQPFAGVGVALVAVRTQTDLPASMDALIDNDAYSSSDPQTTDPWTNQARPGLDLFGGVFFNVTEGFRLSIELGYLLIDVAGGEPDGLLLYATAGHHARHGDYRIDALRLGGGFALMF